jgi:hypothetical protein
MDFQDAARRQHLRTSYYTVWLVGPGGERENLGHTARKTGTGLLTFLYRPAVQERIKALPGAADARLQKFKDRLEFSNGWKLEFGGTIRQEAS